MTNLRHRHKKTLAKAVGWIFFLLLTFMADLVCAQSFTENAADAPPDSPSSPRNEPRHTIGLFSEYSPNSSHIFLGVAQQRRILIGGIEYNYRFHLSDRMAIDFLAQVRPLFLESDPILIGFRELGTGQLQFPVTPQRPVIIDHRQFIIGPGDVVVPSYARQWTYGAGANAFGMKFNFLTRNRIQPVITWAAGFLITQREVPVDHSASFNFSFELGGGLEWLFQPRRSIRLDYRVHHISNANSGTTNPGIDSGFFQFTYSYSFGR